MSQQLFPNSDVSIGSGWTETDAGTNYYEALTDANDTEYIVNSSSSPSGQIDTIEFSLDDPADTPDSTGTIQLSFRVYRSGSDSATGFWIHLMEGSTEIGSGLNIGGEISASTWTTLTVDHAAASLVSDWTNLRIRFRHFRAPNRAHRCSVLRVLVPDSAPTDIEVDPTVTNTGIGGDTTTTITTETVQTAVVSNIQVSTYTPTIETPGNAVIGANISDTDIISVTPTITTERFIELSAVVSNTGISANPAAIQTEDNSVKFIPVSDISMTAADADELTGFDLEALLFNQEKVFAFRLGNVGTRVLDMAISAESINTGIASLVSFSIDKVTYTSTIVVESIPINGVSDPIWVKFSPAETDPAGVGSFVINVEQSNA